MSVIPLACLVLGTACGDDSGSSATSMMGDAGASKLMDGGGRMPMQQAIPRRDAQVADAPDPITPCNRNNPKACASDEVCDLLIRRAPADTSYGFYTGCVKATRERAEGDPCNPDLTIGDQYSIPGLKDVVYRDPCGAGLVCSPNRKVRGAYSCQKVCSSGRLGDAAFACTDPTTLCVRGTQISEFCRTADGCNVERQTGCQGGEACYLIPSDDNKQLLSFCSGQPMTVTADGMPGCSPVSCKPGSVCLGPVRMPINSWTDSNVTCRPVCNGQTGQAPAATSDEDGGVPSGLCSTTTRCEPYSASGLVLSSISTPPFGQCEAQ